MWKLAISCLLLCSTARTQLMSQIVLDNPPKSPVLSDVMSLEDQASIFFSYARESAKMSAILSGVDEYNGQSFTVFVPNNKAVMALSRKPHESPPEPSIEITEEEAYKQSLSNVERWVGVHIVPENLFALEQSAGSHPTLIDDKFITLSRGKTHKSPEWQNWLLNSGIEIIGRRQASNGVMYLIQGTISVE